MADYKPSDPFTTPCYLLQPKYETVKGVSAKIYPDPTDDDLIWVSFKTYGGTETNVNDVYSVIDTANVETWYRPDITAKCAIKLCDTGAIYDVIGEPENIKMRNQYCKFKVQRVKGGA